MPELPEVETIKNDLAPLLIGRCIERAAVFDSRSISLPSPEEFQKLLPGRTVLGLRRRGKYLIAELSHQAPGGCANRGFQRGMSREVDLVIHLRMSGALLLNPTVERKHTRLLLQLDDGARLLLTDPRRFGRVWLADAESVVRRLGPEPLSPAFTAGTFARLLAGRKASIKALLLDQSFLAGVGNMYADEALFAARIHPERAGSSLSYAEIRRLHRAIRRVLRTAINGKGASTSNYVRPDGAKGNAHYVFNVAHRRGARCPLCGSPIERIVHHGRGTYVCPTCQKAL